MHGCAHGQNDVAHILADTGLFCHFHVRGNGSYAGASTEGHGCGLKQMLEHNLGTLLAAADEGIHREGQEHIHEAQNIIDDEGHAVVADELGAVGSHQGGKEAQEANGGIVSNDLDGLHNAVGEIFQQLCSLGLGTTAELYAKAENDSHDDQRQNSSAAEQAGEVGNGEEIHHHVSKAQSIGFHGSFHIGIAGGHHREDPANHIHNHCCNGSGGEEGGQGSTHDLAGPLHGLHIGNGRRYRAEHHRHHDTEHQVGEDGAQRLQHSSAAGNYLTGFVLHDREGVADDTADNDTGEHKDDKAVILQDLFHRSLSFF